MELRQYWHILVNRAGIVAGTFVVALIVAAASVYALPQSASSYDAVLSIAVRPQPIPGGTPYYSDDYYSYVASEYANDDLIDILQSDTFMQAVRARTPNPPPGTIVAKKAHRVVDITVSSSSAAGAQALAQSVAALLTTPESQASYFALFTNRNETLSVVDGPRPLPQAAGRNPLLNLAARALVGLAAGVGLAFLVEYLDDSLRPEDVPAILGWPILAEIPGRGLPAVGKRKT